MSVPTISAALTAWVAAAAAAAGFDASSPEPALPCANPEHGDYQSNHAFRIAKALKQNPRAVAEAVKASLQPHPGVASVVVAGPGFLNIKLNDAWIAEMVRAQAEDPHGGVPQTGAGRTVVIDYSAPNVAKRMHVGHMRSTLIGNALHRLYLATGWTVIADNHIGDWGTPFGKLIVAWHLWLDKDAYDADPIGELERLYVKFGNDADEELKARARAETAKLQKGDPENTALWKQFVAVSLAEFDGVYQRLGVRFDQTLGESAYNDDLPGVLQATRDAGLATESDGAIVIKFGPEDGKGLADTVLVIRKVDGASLYSTTDLATVRYRIQRWNPERIVYVTDTRQQLHFRQIFAVVGKLGWTGPALIHTWFGMLVLPEGSMSTRKGNVVRLVDLLDEAARRARAVVDEKSPSLPEAERAAIAEAVGTAAVRYADLSQNPQSDVTFDWDKMLSLEGNTAPFLMYSYARCRSLQAKGGIAQGEVGALAISDPIERELLLALARRPEIVGPALESGRPNLVCDHLFDLANRFNRFYYELPVLGAETPELRAARLAIVEASARALSRGFDMLGLPALARM